MDMYCSFCALKVKELFVVTVTYLFYSNITQDLIVILNPSPTNLPPYLPNFLISINSDKWMGKQAETYPNMQQHVWTQVKTGRSR